MIYKFYAIKNPFHLFLESPEIFQKLLLYFDAKQRGVILEKFNGEEIYEGCKSLLDDDSIDYHLKELTIYKKANNAFCWMHIYDDYIECNDYQRNPFTHYLLRIHDEYIIIDENDSVCVQNYCKSR
ncbi:MAG: hypothetical protein RR945_05845 [Erysipelotrichaceae bacterium]